jgi:hypothetical protein
MELPLTLGLSIAIPVVGLLLCFCFGWRHVSNRCRQGRPEQVAEEQCYYEGSVSDFVPPPQPRISPLALAALAGDLEEVIRIGGSPVPRISYDEIFGPDIRAEVCGQTCGAAPNAIYYDEEDPDEVIRPGAPSKPGRTSLSP